MIFLDTGYFISLLDRRDVLHARAVAWSHAVDEALVVTDYVVWETFIVMGDRGMTRALAYDHHFEQAGFEALLRRDP